MQLSLETCLNWRWSSCWWNPDCFSHHPKYLISLVNQNQILPIFVGKNNRIKFIKCYLDLSGKCLLLRVKYFLAEIFNPHLGPPIYYYCIVRWGSFAHEVLVVYLHKESSCLPLIGSSDWDQSWRENGHWTTPPTAHQPRCMISERPKNMYISSLLYRIEYGHQIITTRLFAK